MRPALVDDQVLGSVLRGSAPRQLRRRTLFTTGLWYVRLCRAVLGAPGVTGQLSGPFAALPPDLQSRALRVVLALPDDIGLVSLRDLAPAMGQQAHHQLNALNALSAEALAAAVHLDATVFVATPVPRLGAALAAEGIEVRTVEL